MSVDGGNVRGDAARRRRVGHRARFRGVIAVVAALATLVALGATADAKQNTPPDAEGAGRRPRCPVVDRRRQSRRARRAVVLGHGQHRVEAGRRRQRPVQRARRRGGGRRPVRHRDLQRHQRDRRVPEAALAVGDHLRRRRPRRLRGGRQPRRRRDLRHHRPVSPECAALWPTDQLGPITYTGVVDAHPYALALGDWGVYVADAGANAILHVDWFGNIRTVSVLPPQPVVIPADPTALGLPACVGGLTYNFEPVPTDIELSGRSGYVSLLPGRARGRQPRRSRRRGEGQPAQRCGDPGGRRLRRGDRPRPLPEG